MSQARMRSTHQINIDDLVDYKNEYSREVKRAQVTGNQLIGLCPFHDDSKNSFSVDIKTGKWHCFAEDIGGNYLDFVSRLRGISTQEAYAEILEEHGIEKAPSEKPPKNALQPYGIKAYCLEKKFQEQWLADECRCETKTDWDGTTYLAVPYFDESGSQVSERQRYGGKTFRWGKNSKAKAHMYGEWKLPAIRSASDYVILVEGESDTQSLWRLGFPALGVPGASNFSEDDAGRILELPKIYVHDEMDRGAAAFLKSVTEVLGKKHYSGKLYRFHCGGNGDNTKDPSAVYVKLDEPEAKKRIIELLQHAEELPLSGGVEALEAAASERNAKMIIIENAPIALRQPPRWAVSAAGIKQILDDDILKLVCSTPILLTRRMEQEETGDEKIEFAFYRDGRWKRRETTRSVLFNSRSIIALSDSGCMISSENAKIVVKYLADLEAANLDLIPVTETITQFGWHSKGRFFPGAGDGLTLDSTVPEKFQQAFVERGTLDEWKSMVRPLRTNQTFRFLLASSFAPPLLKSAHCRSFIIYNWGNSRSGKTAALKAALSAWGDPNALMINFNATQVGLERMAERFCDLPLGIDERQLAGSSQDALEKTIYMLASGAGRTRGNKNGGVNPSGSWRTIAMMTGEEPITSDTSQTGVSTRMIEIYGGAFEGDEVAASNLHAASEQFCGVAGPKFIQGFLRDKPDVPALTAKMRALIQLKLSDAHTKMGAHTDEIALIAAADYLLDKYLLGDASMDASAELGAHILKDQVSAQSADVNVSALNFIYDWIQTNAAFFDDGADLKRQCYGRFSNPDDGPGARAFVIPSNLRKALREAGYNPKKTFSYMQERGIFGWNPSETKHGYTVSRKIQNKFTWCLDIRMEEPEEHRQITLDDIGDGFTSVGDSEQAPFDVPDLDFS